jgi:Zn-dependent protease with chaperone function
MRRSVENIGKTVRQHWLLIGPAILLALSACQTVQTTQSGVVGVQRQQAMLVSAEQVNQDAQKAYRQVLGEAQKKKTLNADAAVLARVRAIAARLTPATVAFRSDAPGWKWETNVITAKDVNAWCMPGGKIAVYTGLIERLNVTDDELAAVMGHEIAHALREHGRERMSDSVGQSVAATVATETGMACCAGPVGSAMAAGLCRTTAAETRASSAVALVMAAQRRLRVRLACGMVNLFKTGFGEKQAPRRG